MSTLNQLVGARLPSVASVAARPHERGDEAALVSLWQGSRTNHAVGAHHSSISRHVGLGAIAVVGAGIIRSASALASCWSPRTFAPGHYVATITLGRLIDS